MSHDNRTRKLSFLGFGTEGNVDPDELKLDTEMEKLFVGSAPTSARDTDKFDVKQFADTIDKDAHRSKSKASSSVSAKNRRDSTDPANSVLTTAVSSPAKHISDNDEPQLSERAVYGDHNDSDEDARRVQFSESGARNIEALNVPDNNINDDESSAATDDHRKRKGRHQHFKHRKSSMQDNPGVRRQSNGERVSVQPEDSTLEEADIDELISHRSDDPRGMRRHKVQPTSRKDSGLLPNISTTITTNKRQIDRSPHEVFVQLDELHGTGDEREWKETARWIKYEEDVELGSDRWGKPHVASLSFHSLLNLRRCLETGVVLMDLDERDLPGVAYRVVEEMVADELIHEDDKPIVMRALLLRHRHVNEHSHGGFRRKFSMYTSLQNLNSHDSKPRILPSSEINGFSIKNGETHIDMKEETYTASQEDLKRALNDTILKRIPQGAEATTVLVGTVDFLKQPTIAFVRLAEGVLIPGVTEVPIPVRFMFILLGPKQADLDYHEVGRAISTLMSDEHFHKIAYKADDRRELLSAINDFLDDSIVLPPGNWQRDDLLPFDELKAKNEYIRERKQKALQHKNKDKKAIEDEEKQLLAEAESHARTGGSGDKRGRKGPLERTNRPWGGLINDIKRRYPMYKSDIQDGLNTETLAATVFMYFAALSTAITFGGLASEKTHNLIGISETLLSASVVGMIFHLLCGQPLVIVGTTGPLLLFDEALYHFCLQNNFDFLSVRVYVGMWIAVIALVVSGFEGSVYVRKFTRFTQELFSALITLIYIVETITKLIKVYRRHPLLYSYVYKEQPIAAQPSPIAEALSLNENGTTSSYAFNFTTISSIVNESFHNSTTPESSGLDAFDKSGMINQPNTALFCTMLTMGTFALAYYLRIFRNSHFLGRNARRALGDFGVPISIALFVTLDYCIPQVFTDKLSVPEGLSPSDPTTRGWLIPFGSDLPVWVPFAAVVPAMLVYILGFMESHISELIVDKPERGLKKGSGLHLDIVLLSFLNVGCGFFGMPWHCAATVRSVSHVSSVTIMSRTHAPGEKPYIADVKEQRVSGFVVALFVGLSVMMGPLLRLIPMSVLFGVFFYMGISSMSGVQLFDRLRLLLMPVKYHPTEPYVKRVLTWKMHIFTGIQVCSLALLWTVASSRFSLAFPFVLVLMVPLRAKLDSYFTPQELNALDGSAPKVDPDNEPDFYEQASIPA